MTTAAYAAAKVIQQHVKNFAPKIGMILGSGSGKLAKTIENAIVIPYAQIPGFHATTVEGHEGNLYLGTIQGAPVACLQGRPHYYEGAHNDAIKTMVRTLKLIGCDTLLATNASGSLHLHIPVGSLVIIKDHINFQFNTALVGKNDEDFGSRFVSLQDAYDPLLRKHLSQIAQRLQIKTIEGVYLAVLGPAFETPAEIKAYRTLGADVVGMSTVPEVVVARHCGMRVSAISVATNLAAGLTDLEITHEETLASAQLATNQLIPLVTTFIAEHFQHHLNTDLI